MTRSASSPERSPSSATSRASLGWDQETYLPPKGVAHRAKQLAQLSGLIHRKATSQEFGDLIARCEDAMDDEFEAGSPQAANIREWRWNYDRDTKLPGEFVEAFEQIRSLAMQAWQGAREKNDFAAFRPHLEKIIQFNQEKADFWGYESCRYDALLDSYERGAKRLSYSDTFDELKAGLVEIAAASHERSAAIPADRLSGHFPIAAQQELNREVAAAFGFDFEAGRIDTATHPFCTGLGRTTLASRLATTSPISPVRSTVSSTSAATGCTSRTCRRSSPARLSAMPSRSASTSPSRACGRTTSEGNRSSGTTGSIELPNCSPNCVELSAEQIR